MANLATIGCILDLVCTYMESTHVAPPHSTSRLRLKPATSQHACQGEVRLALPPHVRGGPFGAATVWYWMVS
jgi:hypothetical protein